MTKRAAEKQITKDGPSYSDKEDESGIPQPRERAPDEVLAQRKIVTVKRGAPVQVKQHSPRPDQESKSPKHEPASGLFGGLSGLASKPISSHAGDESSPKSERRSIFGGLSSLAKEDKDEEPSKGTFSSLFSAPAAGEGLFSSSSFSFNAPSGSLFGASTEANPSFPSFGAGDSKPGTPEDSEEEPEPEQAAAVGAQSDEMEGEVQIYQNDCKLYKLTREDEKGAMKWIEKCIGFVRLLKNEETGNMRLVVRMKGVYRLVLNVALLEKICKAEKQGNKSIRFNGIEEDESLGMFRLNLITEDQQEAFHALLSDSLRL